MTRGLPVRGASARRAGRPLKALRPWVARLLGLDGGRIVRDFVDPSRDYVDASANGTRGVYMYYILDHGETYEVCEWVSTSRTERYFVRVTEAGDIARVPREEVEAWLSESAI